MCYVGDSRPRIQLMWVKRTLIKETNITFEAYYSTNGIVESSFVNTTYTFNNSECLVLLACKAVGDTTWLKTRESLVLAECPQASYFSDTPQIRYVEIDSSVTLECTHTVNVLVVWKRYQENGGYKVVDFAVNTGNNASNTYISNHSLSHGNSLFIEDVSYEVEGLYSCVFGNGTNWGMAIFNVTVHAQPFSVILRIEGCDVSDKCEIEMEKMLPEERNIDEGTSQITAFLKEQPETYTLIMRCIYERNGDVGDIKDSLEKMCKDPVIFYNKESSLKQNTTLKLLDICSVSKINIAAVWCYNCIEHDNCSEDFLALESGAAIRILITLKELMLYSEGIKMNNTNVSPIFKYAAKCSNLVKLTIWIMKLVKTSSKRKDILLYE
ncbi:hypothetical protein HOLleu_00959 [Holothuria leucospilota]|uniref:Immunoglobulin domain-containing protein n=1 Tax=Holothuria leucospilota TaxID=206669 RepID=A0A9Q1CQD4_HOLLE|nr:hypothetical protein HOLleu_00959 [Holothuria leucospilota]